MKKFFKIKTPRFVAGLILAAIILSSNLFYSGVIKASIVFAILFIISGAFNIDSDAVSQKTKWIIYIIWVLITSFITCFLSELALNENLLSLGAFRIILGCIICLVLFLLLYAISLCPVVSVSIIIAILILGTTINYYVYQFRGSEVQPADYLAIVTAGDIASEYHVRLTKTVLYAFVLAVIYIFFSFGLPRLKLKSKLKSRFIIIAADLLLLIMFLFLSRNVSFFNYLNIGTKTNGYILNFTLQLKETFVKKPSPYSVDTIVELSEKYKSTNSSQSASYPDIIVIMNESFADLSYLGNEIRTNIDVTPFIDSLEDNTVKGYALTSVFGGNTANSEFEFLTGHSMMFLPTGSVAYQQFIDYGDYSMVNELNSLGYSTIAMHPNQGRSWARDVVYNKLGFDEELFIDSFPNQNYCRDFISDQEMFETLINKYKNYKNNSDAPVFIYGVTIQNHGSYEYVGDNYQQTVFLEDYSQDYSDVEQYLSIIHETDKATKWLLDYYSKVENDVVVVFYGDHYPNLNEQFFEEVHGGSFDTLDEQQQKYTIPFFIWTNYNSEEKYVPLTSLNYLSGYVYSTAGIPLPEYNKALLDISDIVPALNSNGYYSISNGSFSTMEAAIDELEKSTINLYNQIEYNAMFDKKHRNNVFFPR